MAAIRGHGGQLKSATTRNADQQSATSHNSSTATAGGRTDLLASIRGHSGQLKPLSERLKQEEAALANTQEPTTSAGGSDAVISALMGALALRRAKMASVASNPASSDSEDDGF